MSLLRKKDPFLLVVAYMALSCLMVSILAGDLPAHNSHKASVIFVIDYSSSMSSKIDSMCLVIADMIERGISGRLKDGDEIIIWTYSDRLNTNVVPPYTWNSMESRHISNLVFTKTRSLRLTKKVTTPIDLTHVFRGNPRSNSKFYIVTDGNRKISGIPVEDVVSNVFIMNKERWRKEKLICLVGMEFKNETLINWAIGEGSASTSIKTIARMPEVYFSVRNTNENEIKMREVIRSEDKQKGEEAVEKTGKLEEIQKQVTDDKKPEYVDGRLDVKENNRRLDIPTNLMNKVEIPHKIPESNTAQPDISQSDQNKTNLKKDEILVDLKRPAGTPGRPLIDATIVSREYKPGDATTVETNIMIGSATQDRVKVPVFLETNKWIHDTDEKTNEINFTAQATGIRQSVLPAKEGLIQPEQIASATQGLAKSFIVSETQVEKESSVSPAGEKMAGDLKIVDQEIATKTSIPSVRSERELIHHVLSVQKRHPLDMTISNVTSMKSDSGSTAEIMASAHDRRSDWLLKLALVLAGMAIILWVIAMFSLRYNAGRHSLITKGYSKKNLIKK